MAGGAAVGIAVRALRALYGISQGELAQRIGSHRNYVGSLERGELRDVQVGTIVRLAEALDVTTDIFAGRFLGDDTRLNGAEFTRVGGGGATAMGWALRAVRVGRCATIAELSAASDIHHNYIALLERGGVQSPRLSTIARLTRSLSDSDEHQRDVFAAVVCHYSGEAEALGAPSRLRTRRQQARLRGAT